MSRHRGSDVAGVDFVAVDVETTGRHGDFGDRVIEVAAVRIRDGEVIDEFATLVNPGQEIDNTEIHGITTADVRGAPTFKKIARTLLSYLSGTVMVSHKAKFDHKFLSHEFNRVEIDIREIPTLCTLLAARSQLDLSVYKLPKVMEQVIGIPPDYEHTALDDARTTGRLLCGFLHDAPERLRLSTPKPIDWDPRPTLGGVSTRHRVIAADGLDLVHLVKQLPITYARQPVNADFASYEVALHQAMNDRKIDLELGELIRCDGLVRAAVEQIRRELLEHHRLDVHAHRKFTWQEVYALYKDSPPFRPA